MSRMHWLWRELNRPRGRQAREGRRGRGSRGGIALLMVVSVIALMTVLVTEVLHSAAIRIQMGANQRDEAKAEALAQAGIQFYRLLLIGSKQLDGSPVIAQISQFLPFQLNANQLWQLIPTVDSGIIRMLVYTDGDEDEAREIANSGGLTDQQRDETQVETSLRKSFLDFDGDFSASVEDEESRIYVGKIVATDMQQLMLNPQASLLAGLMSGQRQDEWMRNNDLDRWELISNLVDWTDMDDVRLFQGGGEDQLYDNGDDPYPTKNSAFDSWSELRLVDGWHLDRVWRRYGEHLTIYGNGKVNVNTADRRVLEALLLRYVQPEMSDDTVDFVIQEINRVRNTPPELGGGIFNNPQSFVNLVTMLAPGTVDQGMSNAIKATSSTFRVRSEGIVGRSRVVIEVIFDFSNSPFGKVLSWRIL